MNLIKLHILIIYICLTHLAVGQDSIQKHFANDSGLIETPWKNGKINGIQKAYYKDGKLRGEAGFVDGWLSGVSKSYYKNGQVSRVSYYHKNLREGADTSFFDDGKSRNIGFFVDGKLDGPIKVFNPDGKCFREGQYEKGLQVGILKGYKDGKLFSEEHHLLGKVDWYKEYDENGTVIKHIEYDENGKSKK